MSELKVLVERLGWTLGGKSVRVEGLVDAELVRVLSIITGALSESEGTIIQAKLGVHDGFPVRASSDAPGPCAWGWSDRAWG